MTDELRTRLEQAIGGTYRFERELGGGGMSRVFLAEEIELGRQVVIKVLPPEMAAGVNQERFRREVQLSARLQHSHIVPVLAAGSAGDLLYYVMPFIEGESLRARLAREGELPVAEAARILRQVTDALSYAHERGIVHRDIKPDNVMLSHGNALVTDFGVAKAVSESAGGAATMTSMGMAIGTPAYMSPEQAAGDPQVDHRADLYALGVMGYEMLAGRAVFEAPTAQALMAAHVTQTPEPIETVRSAVPPALATAVMRCLEKRAADRWQHARDIIPLLEGAVTPGGSGAWALSTGLHKALRSPTEVAVRITVIGLVALGLTWLVTRQVGLPDWVFYAGLGVVAFWAPAAAMAARQDRRRARAQLSGTTVATPAGLGRHLTWQKAKFGVMGAFASLGGVAALFMVLRALGVGPFATLVSAGTMSERDPIILAEFENATSDSTLGVTIAELLRIDLAQSKVLSVFDQVQLRSALARMELPGDARMSFDLARELATREGLKAILTGEVRPLGAGYVLSARLVATGSGEVLWAGRQDVAGPEGLSTAIDKLSGLLREKAGESLRSLRSDPPLDQVTTRSLEALQAYVQSDRANDAGDQENAIALLERALRADSTFAMGWRRLGVLLQNKGSEPERANAALTRAWELRDRLSVRERFLTEAVYASYITRDTAGAIAAYEAVLEQYPNEAIALNNLAVIHGQMGRFQDALRLYRQSVAYGVAPASTYGNMIPLEFKYGGDDSARVAIQRFQAAFPDNPAPLGLGAGLALASMQIDTARTLLEVLLERERGSPQWESQALQSLSGLAYLEGKLEEGDRWFRDLVRLGATISPAWREFPVEDVVRAGSLGNRASVALEFEGDAAGAARMVEEGLRLIPLARRPAAFRNDYQVAEFFARVGDVRRARQLMAEAQLSPNLAQAAAMTGGRVGAESQIALAEGRLEEALDLRRQARKAAPPACGTCSLFELAEIFDKMGQADSAIHYFEALLADRQMGLMHNRHAVVYRRLGELYEARGDRGRAIEYYRKFVDLWKNADPVLQPKVEEARRRVARLAGEPG